MPFPTSSYTPKPVINSLEASGTVNEVKAVRDFGNIDSLISELNIAKESISNASDHAVSSKTTDEITALNPDEIISKDDALKTGTRFAKVFDTVFSFGVNIYSKEKENPDKYKASDNDIKDLSEAWSEISETYNIKFSPWPNLILLTMIVYGPLLKNAKDDRWRNEMKETLELQAKKQEETSDIVNELKEKIAKLEHTK